MEKIIEQDIKAKLEELSKLVAPCLQCASCAAACPVFQTHFERNPRQVALRLARGDFSDVLADEAFWWCGSCYSCEAHCPQGVPLTHVFFELKRLAVEASKPVPKLIQKIGERLSEGFISPATPDVQEKRKKLDLPPVAKPDLQEIQKILDVSGLSQKLKS